MLPSFSKQLIEYTESTFKEELIEIKTKTMVKKRHEHAGRGRGHGPGRPEGEGGLPLRAARVGDGQRGPAACQGPDGKIPAQRDSRRGLAVNEYLVVQGARDIWAVGDCAVAGYAPTAQVAAQEGNFLARLFNNMAKTEGIEEKIQDLSSTLNLKPGNAAEISSQIEDLQRQLRRTQDIKPFHYSHQGSLAYIGSEKAVADVSWFNGNVATGGSLTFLFWRSAYLSMCFSCKFGNSGAPPPGRQCIEAAAR